MRQLPLMVLSLLLLAILVPSSRSIFAATVPSPIDVQHPVIYRLASLTSPGVPPFVPSDIRKAYNFLPLYSRGIKGNGTRIAIIDAFGDPSLSTDLSSFDSLTGLPLASVNTFYPDGVPKKPNSGWALETALDVEWAHAIAPSATIDLVVALDSSLGHIFDGVSFVASNLTNETSLSMSFGLAESSYPTTGSFTITATHGLFITMTSHGTTVFASSGDSGASSCCNVQYPASDPLVVAVGGTSLTLNSTSSYAGETAWSGSSAGSSVVFAKPSWQVGLGDSMRDVVDISYDADPNTGVLVVQGGKEFQVGGTSAGSPQWAALAALASQANSLSYGSILSKLYKLTSYHDVTSGSDGFFSAKPGWDYPTGLGTPDANATVTSLAPTSPAPPPPSGSTGGGSPPRPR
jgi:subtilase family serine protease